MLKKTLAFLCVAALLCAMGITALADFEPKAAHIEITITTPTMPDTADARALLFPYYVNQFLHGTFQWSSSDPSIASVDEYGTVTGLKEGVCTVTGVLTNNSGVASTQSAKVTVSYGNVDFVDTSYTTIKVGETLDLRAIQHPNYTNSFLYGNIRWDSENISIAKVDANGIVTGLTEGLCAIVSTHENLDRSISTKQTVVKIEA